MSAIGTKRTSMLALSMSTIGGKADIHEMRCVTLTDLDVLNVPHRPTVLASVSAGHPFSFP
jgi:hypothetical protein